MSNHFHQPTEAILARLVDAMASANDPETDRARAAAQWASATYRDDPARGLETWLREVYPEDALIRSRELGTRLGMTGDRLEAFVAGAARHERGDRGRLASVAVGHLAEQAREDSDAAYLAHSVARARRIVGAMAEHFVPGADREGLIASLAREGASYPSDERFAVLAAARARAWGLLTADAPSSLGMDAYRATRDPQHEAAHLAAVDRVRAAAGDRYAV